MVRHHGDMNDATELVAYAESWYRYGGGDPDDILVRFGLTEVAYFTRLREALSTDTTLDPAVRDAIDVVAAGRIEAGPGHAMPA